MKINIHVTVSKNSIAYFDYMQKNYSQLLSKNNKLKFHAYCLDEYSFDEFRRSKSVASHFVNNERGTKGHCEAIKLALSKIKSLSNNSINVIADSDTVMLIREWDKLLVDELSKVNILGSSYEAYGGFSSGSGNVQTYKNKPNFTWFAMSKKVDFSDIDVTPYKGSHLDISSDLEAEIYQLPIGFRVLRDTGWQIPYFLHKNNISYKVLTHEKPTKNAKIIKTNNDYHEEYQLDSLPFVGHQRGSMSHKFKNSEISNQFYSIVDSHFCEKENSFFLREVCDNDHDWLVELHNDPEVLKNLTNPQPITLESHLSWWNCLNKEKEKRYIFCVDEEKVGFCKIYSIDHNNNNCVLGADIHKNYRGKGYAKFMWKLMLQVCFNTLNLHRVSLTTASYNSVGQKVYKNLGFKEEGRQVESLYREEKYHDSICMYLLRQDWNDK